MLPPIDFSESYRAAWDEYKRLRSFCFLIWLGGVPFLAVLSYLLGLASPRFAEYVFFILGLAWIVSWIYFAASLQSWSCPRCGNRFSATWWYNKSIFARKCVHCGLRKFEVPAS
jgi:hypothetical protein